MQIAPLLAIPVAAALFGAGCGGSTAGSAPAKDAGTAVTIKAFQFQPDPVTVKAGEKITFKNVDATIHTIVGGTRKAPDKSVLDGSTGQDETYTVTIDEPGTYRYFCDRHNGPGMTAKLVVE